MKKTLLGIAGALALLVGASAGPAAAGEGKPCPEAKAAKTGKAQKVSLEGTVVTYGCEMEAAKQECTGAALAVGERRHLIKKAGKGSELVGKAKDTNKIVKVQGTKAG